MSATTLISAASLDDLIEQDAASLVVLDCRFSLMDFSYGQNAYIDGHIPGAYYADLNDDLAGTISKDSGRHPLPNFEDFKSKMVSWGINSGSQVVVYDDVSGAMAARAWWMIKHWSGFSSVAVLDGGIDAWTKHGGTLETLVRTPDQSSAADQSTLEVKQNHQACVSVTDIEQGKFAMLVDARSQVRFAGQSEPIDARAGHIPGAQNLPFEGNLDSDTGCFLPPASLQQRFVDLKMSDADAGHNVHMCGSGVTACHNMLAAELAGYHPGMLYVGSWSEWITNPDHPIATISPTE